MFTVLYWSTISCIKRKTMVSFHLILCYFPEFNFRTGAFPFDRMKDKHKPHVWICSFVFCFVLFSLLGENMRSFAFAVWFPGLSASSRVLSFLCAEAVSTLYSFIKHSNTSLPTRHRPSFLWVIFQGQKPRDTRETLCFWSIYFIFKKLPISFTTVETPPPAPYKH